MITWGDGVNWEIGQFGAFQSIFEDSFLYQRDLLSPSYYIKELEVSRGEHEDGTKFYKMVFKSRNNNAEYATFTATFEDRGDPNNSIKKSTTLLSIDKGNAISQMKEHYDILDYSSMCERWIIDAIFTRNYLIVQLILISPPKCNNSIPKIYNIECIDIRTNEDEDDEFYVQNWLTYFRTTDIKRPECLIITSHFNKMMISHHEMLRTTSKIELNGKFDIRTNTIRTFDGMQITIETMSSWGDDVTWQIGEFGEFDRQFRALCNMRIDIGPTECFVEILEIKRGKHPDGTKFYRMIFYPNNYRMNDDIKFIATFEDRGDPNNSIKKSTTLLSIDKGNAISQMKEHYDILDYSSMCERWIIDAIFVRQYNISHLVICSPPKCNSSIEKICKIYTLEIRAEEDEKDIGYVKYWLTFLTPQWDCPKPRTIIINSPFVEMSVASDQMLAMTAKVELNGLFDIKHLWFVEFGGKCFIWKNMEERRKLGTTIFQTLSILFKESERHRTIYLEQGSDEENRRIKEFLEENLGENMSNDGGYRLAEEDDYSFFAFYMTENWTVFGRFPDESLLDVKNVVDWDSDDF
ncbi:unnamed protein product [Caenorhabditis angaria]|uniref:Uncharacterized protein n=1 Tax=Caenorhabditis angaria TaxID=860376 RepID=A0A9P1ISM4_9PELO|nr:unnamed protein product [Caenorhabditis angaria]